MDTFGNLLEFLRITWTASKRNYILIFVSMALWCLLIVAFAIIKGPMYSSSMTVRAADNVSGVAASVLKKLPISLGALGSGGNDQLSSYIALLQSEEVARLLIQRDHFDRVIFAPSIDQSTGKWRTGIKRDVKIMLNGAFGLTTSDRPTVEDMQRRLTQLIAVNQDQMTDLVTVTCTAFRRDLCRTLLLAVHREAEYRLGQMQQQQAVATRDYILANIDNVTQTESKQFMFDTLTDANNQIVMARLNRPVAAIIVDPPLDPTQPSFPKPLLLILFGIAAGLATGIIIALILYRSKSIKFAAAT